MSRIILTIAIFSLLLLVGCVKNQDLSRDNSLALLREAKTYFHNSVLSSSSMSANYSAKFLQNPLWEKAWEVSLQAGKGLMVPLTHSQPLFVKPDFSGEHLFNLDNLCRLFIYKDSSSHWRAEVLTWYPDSNYVKNLTGNFSGMLSVQDWWGNDLSTYLYTGGQVLKYRQSNVQANTIIRTCSVIYGYNYAVGDPGGGYSYIQAGPCYDMYIPDRVQYGNGGAGFGGGGSAGGSGSLPGRAPYYTVFTGTNPIANIKDYEKCLTNVGGSDHNYKVTICVDQPEPGTRTPWTPVDGGPLGSSAAGNMVDVGHTFLVFTEEYGGTTITRNIGFYPTGITTPWSRTSQGMLNNDEGHTYNISATFTVTNGQFFNMLTYASRGNDPGFMYNLNTENCTTYALQALIEGGIYLPNTLGSWTNGMGNNPGDLGEDIRQMNNLPNMTKGTVELYHPNMGNCN